MNDGQHYIVTCMECGVVIRQCRCPSADKTEISEMCDKCSCGMAGVPYTSSLPSQLVSAERVYEIVTEGFTGTSEEFRNLAIDNLMYRNEMERLQAVDAHCSRLTAEVERLREFARESSSHALVHCQRKGCHDCELIRARLAALSLPTPAPELVARIVLEGGAVTTEATTSETPHAKPWASDALRQNPWGTSE